MKLNFGGRTLTFECEKNWRLLLSGYSCLWDVSDIACGSNAFKAKYSVFHSNWSREEKVKRFYF